MYKALIAFTALLGLFSFHSYAQFECVPLASTTQFMSMSGGSGCPERSFKVVGSTQCEVILHQPQCIAVDGEWFGTYRFTGAVYSASGGGDFSNQLTPIQLINTGTASSNNPDQAVWVASLLTGFVEHGFEQSSRNQAKLGQNDKIINDNVSRVWDTIDRMNAEVSSKLSDIRTANNSVDFKLTDLTYDIFVANSKLTNIESTLEDIERTSAEDAVNNEQLHQQTHAGQAAAQGLLSSISQDADNAAHNSALAFDYASQANYNAQQASIAATDAGGIGAMAYQAANGALENTNAIYSMLYEMTEGETGEPGEGPNMAETNAILTDIQNDLNNSSFTTQNHLIAVNDRLDGLLGQGQGLSNQLGQQLNQIKTAIEDNSGGGGSIPDDLLDVTNQELSQLRQLVASNHAASQEQLQNLNTTASGQSQQLASISTAVSGIGESLDSIKSGLSGSAYESPGMTDTDIKESLGVGEVVGREDLFTDDIELDSFTGSYAGWLGTSTCPDIPAFDLPFDIQWKLDLKLFCDALGIFGVFVMAAAYFSVPFIVFGGKK